MNVVQHVFLMTQNLKGLNAFIRDMAGSTQMRIMSIRNKVRPILRKYKIKKAALFGSYARGHPKKRSDIDILVEIKDKKMSLLDFIHIKHELEAVLHKKVDLVEYKQLRKEIKHNVRKEIVDL